MKILVTGCASFIGRQICKDLSEISDEVYSSYNESSMDYFVKEMK